jgi:cell fate (sporulation/competence/biofilm development) regulator YlbF (YheA/YmcA/DUF963 family)
MNPYDRAHQLARSLKDSDEYKEYKQLKQRVEADTEKKELVDEFRKKQLELQLKKTTGQDIDDGDMERLHYLFNMASADDDVKAMIQAEQRLGQLLSDIYKIIGDALKLDGQ